MSYAKDTTPEGYIYFGEGPLKVLNEGHNYDVATFCSDNKWDTGAWAGNGDFEYAIKAGSELARLNGLEETPKKVLTSNPKAVNIPTMKYTIPDQSLAPKQFKGYVYV